MVNNVPSRKRGLRGSKMTPLQRARLKHGFTQAQTAALIGISQQSYHQYETGEVLPPPKRQAQLSRALSEPPEKLWPLTGRRRR